ncbi:MAG: type II secretion system protein GspG [Phycisphaerales bacterium]|nr:MAG: type II secretion system protein GspG [Phycisphaerales bacterium]
MKRIRRDRRRRAFTLLEVLLVAGILALLAAFAVPALMKQADKAKIGIATAAVGRNGPIAKGLDNFRFDIGRYPDTSEGLAALFKAPSGLDDEGKWKGPYIEGTPEELRDPWDNEYEYKSPGEVNESSYDLWSRGLDGKDDGGKEGSDDIKNWRDK